METLADPATERTLRRQGGRLDRLEEAEGQVQRLRVRNATGSELAKGRAVYLSGASDELPAIALARADALATLPAIGLVEDAIAAGQTGTVLVAGVLEGVDTSAFAVGDTLYVSDSSAGALVATAPADLPQKVGRVLVDDAARGKILALLEAVVPAEVVIPPEPAIPDPDPALVIDATWSVPEQTLLGELRTNQTAILEALRAHNIILP